LKLAYDGRSSLFTVDKLRLRQVSEETHVVDEASKLHTALTAMPDEAVAEFRDFLLNALNLPNPFTTFKQPCLKRRAQTKDQRILQALMNEELNDDKPSQFLRRIQRLLGRVSDDIARLLFLSKLPLPIRTALVPFQDQPLTERAELAYQIAIALQISALQPKTAINAVSSDNSSFENCLERLESLFEKFIQSRDQPADDHHHPGSSRSPMTHRRHLLSPNRSGRRSPSPSTQDQRTPVSYLGKKIITVQLADLPALTWTFFVADVGVAIIGADILHHHAITVDIKHSRLVMACNNAHTLPSNGAPATESTDKYQSLLARFYPHQDAVQVTVKQLEPNFVLHAIETTGQPVHSKPGRLPPQKLQVAKEHFNDLLRRGATVTRRTASVQRCQRRLGQRHDVASLPPDSGTVKNSCRPLAFFSKRLTATQKRYSAFRRELLAAYLAAKHFRHAVEGRRFMVYTDLKPLAHARSDKVITIDDEGVISRVTIDRTKPAFTTPDHANSTAAGPERKRGTSRRTRYYVLYDESKINPDMMQSITYDLCHLCGRCTHSVSITAPVYFADLVCARADCYVLAKLNSGLVENVSDENSNNSNSSSEAESHVVDEASKLHTALTAMPDEAVAEFRDFLLNALNLPNPFTTFKQPCLKRRAQTKDQRILQALMNEELNDDKPSQFLRRIQRLLGRVSDDIARLLFLSKLPLPIRTALVPFQDQPLTERAELAYQIAIALQISALQPKTAINAVSSDNSSFENCLERLESLFEKFIQSRDQPADDHHHPGSSRSPMTHRRHLLSPNRSGRRSPSPSTQDQRTPVSYLGKKIITVQLADLPALTWTFFVADVGVAIIGADILHHHAITVDIKHSRLVMACNNAHTLPSNGAPATESTDKYQSLLARFYPHQDAVQVTVKQLEPNFVLHAIETTGQPVHSKPGRLPPQKLQVAKEHFNDLLRRGATVTRRTASVQRCQRRLGQRHDVASLPPDSGTVKNSCRPLAFFSKRLTATQKRYSAFRRELLAAYLAAKHFRHAVEGRRFMVYTDLKPLAHARSDKVITIDDEGVISRVTIDRTKPAFTTPDHANSTAAGPERKRGTSRRTRYYVLYDESKINPDMMQSITYDLCHLCGRCTHSVSITAPVYFADLVCARADCYVLAKLNSGLVENVSDENSNNSNSSSEAESVIKELASTIALHNNVKKIMYYA
ncbi:putative protein tag-76, partial [Trichinella papuae]